MSKNNEDELLRKWFKETTVHSDEYIQMILDNESYKKQFLEYDLYQRWLI